MQLSHLQQQVAELRENLGDHRNAADFHQHVVMLHCSISGIASACDQVPDCQCAPQAADILIQLANFPTLFPDWGEVWGGQDLEDFHVETLYGDVWSHLFKLHQLTAGLVGGRSDIILLYKMIQVCRSLCQLLGIDLTEAVNKRLEELAQRPPLYFIV